MLCNFVLEYLYDRFYVFGNSLDTNRRAQRQREEDAETEASADDR
jgi:hypothetical protein